MFYNMKKLYKMHHDIKNNPIIKQNIFKAKNTENE